MRLLAVRKIKFMFCLIFLTTLISISGYAQTKRINGTIVSADDSKPMPGVTIKVRGAKTGAISAADGTYSITANPTDVLVFTFVSYTTQQINVGAKNTIDVKMSPSASNLNEVVVTGYAKAKRKDVTGSISSIKGDDLRQTQPTTFDQALQGKVAGVVVQQISGQPGGGVSIQIRGVSSITGSNSPLYVIDGIIIPPVSDPGSGGNPLNSINPADIESIDVLKDASATAIYGSQATNGVIVITTKRGKAGPPTVSYDFYTGDQEIAKKLPTMNLQQYASFMDARAVVWGFGARPEFANPQYLGVGTNWQNELFRRAPMNNHNLSVSGGDNRTQYLLSGSYFDQEGIALGSNFQRYSVRLNLDNKTTNWLKVGTSIQMAHINQNQNTSASNVISSALSLTPDVPVQNSDGSWGGVTTTDGWVPGIVNPVAIARLVTNVSTRNQMFGNAYAEIQFTKDLSLRTEVSGNFDFGTANNFTPTYTFGKVINGTNSGSSSSSQNIYTVLRNFATYNHDFGKYKLNVLAGYEAQSSSFENVGGGRSNFPSNNVISLNAGDPTSATNSGSYGRGGASESFFGRVNFSWNDKYLITGNIRDDGSSNFPSKARWGTTYSGAFAWKINNEPFLKNVKSINELKLRVGYGLTNNQNIPGNTYVTQLTTEANGISGIAQFQSNLPNPNVRWETTNYYDGGIDGTFFNGRLNFSLDVYDRETSHLLLAEPLPLYSGSSTGYSPGSMAAPYANVGSMRNRGIDLHVSSTNINSKDFVWRSDFTISRNVNKVLSLGNGGSDASLAQKSYTNNEIVEKTVVGQPIGEFYGYLFDGVFAHPKDFQTHALPVDQNGKPYPISSAGGGIWYGDRMFKDLNGDGIIDSKDQTFLGSPIPKFQYGVNNSFTYKNFDLNFFFSGSVGNKIFNEMSIVQTNPIASTAYFTSVLNYAKLGMVDPGGSASDINNVYVVNPNTKIVGLRNDITNDNTRSSNIYIQDGTYLKCKNITLGYRVPENILSKIYVHSIRIYATVTNVFTVTKYVGMDPEIGSWNPLQAGWDSGYYPQPRVYTIGANITFNK
ncbi:TonB-dependent receptor [Mucilaginibacter sp. BT774]|uniref:SusC/RagA family TonB-linked outer membrane protein n=1 Tax=Mucilaginibacter sp. BT774 TaxID=3062276 RepID=UPI002674ECF3|nr:TonB-dependent receptor [Mucilaginibacter sp. BT774]MDO3628949.1 TonB-dependent receptor [Mucilaginibacter sp. BT774]